MEGGIFCTYGYFGTFKTLGNSWLIRNKLRNGEIVFSNIKMNLNYLDNPHNFYYFDDIKNLHDILAFSGLFAVKVGEYDNEKMLLNMPGFSRNFRPKINIFFDEMGIFANSSEYKKFHDEIGEDLIQYLLQIRKLFVNLYFIIQKPNRLVKELREYVQFWIRPRPTFENWGLLNHFLKNKCITYYQEVLDNEKFEIEYEIIDKMDLDGNIYQIKKPLRFPIFKIWWVPFQFKFYSDLYINFKNKIEFKTDFLKESGFFNNLKLGYINNKALIYNKEIYVEYFDKDDKNNTNPFQINKNPGFFNNPNYYFHIYSEILGCYIKNPFLIFKNIYYYLKKYFI